MKRRFKPLPFFSTEAAAARIAMRTSPIKPSDGFEHLIDLKRMRAYVMGRDLRVWVAQLPWAPSMGNGC